MSRVEYCDNINCLFNRQRECSAPGVVFDENAICVTARYDDENLSQTDSEKAYASDDKTDTTFEDKWIKYI